MPNRNDQHNNAPTTKAAPFFARYLEGQIDQEMSEEALAEIAGGGGGAIQTERYPSDEDDVSTKRFPSDEDETQTMKYPSDNEDPGI